MVRRVAMVKTPTSATRSSLIRRAGDHRLRRAVEGFTLVELLVVFAIAGLLTVVVPIAFDSLRQGAQYRQTVRSMVTDMKAARNRAVQQGVEVRFKVDLAQSAFGIDGGVMHDVPPSLQIKATVASIEMDAGEVAAIRFLPSGGATGGSIDVMRPSGSGVRLNVDWLSGRVAQQPLAQ
jgi:general secretion pathway protein H